MTQSPSPSTRRKEVIATTRNLLRACDEQAILEGLDTVREEGLEELWSEVLGLLSSPHERVHSALLDLLIDVHSTSLIPHLGHALSTTSLPSDRLARLLSVCWQSPLDCSPLIPHLIPYLDHPDLRVVIEAMTSLEIALDHASRAQLQETTVQLKQLVKEVKRQEVKLLLEELVSTAARTLQQVVNAERESHNTPPTQAGHPHSHEEDECDCGCH